MILLLCTFLLLCSSYMLTSNGVPIDQNLELVNPILFNQLANEFQYAIVNGEKCPWEEAKFLVQVRQSAWFYETFCGGSLIAPRTVLTAAHCVNSLMGNIGLSIRYGTKELSESTYPDISVSAVHIHPQFVKKYAQNDIAILTLSRPIVPNKDVTYARWHQSGELPVRSQVSVYGWGKVTGAVFGPQAEELQKTNLSTWDARQCNAALNSAGLPNNDKVICANSPTGIACQGDSGGPMISADGRLVGLASEVQTGCPLGGLNVYTKIAAYEKFIQKFKI